MDANAWLTPIHRGLLYKEWLAHRNVIVGFWALWLACGLVLPVFHHPGWILALGLLYVFLVAARVAGADALDRSEEFAFALPPTRRQIFLVRLALAGGNLVALLAAGLVTIALGLPQLLWGLVVESVLTEPFPATTGLWYALACCCPLAVFACVFVIAALARSPAQVSRATLNGVPVAAGVAIGAEVIEKVVWTSVTWVLVWPALLVLVFVILPVGLFFYERKEGVSRPESVRSDINRYVWLILVLLGLLAGLLAVLVLA